MFPTKLTNNVLYLRRLMIQISLKNVMEELSVTVVMMLTIDDHVYSLPRSKVFSRENKTELIVIPVEPLARTTESWLQCSVTYIILWVFGTFD